MAKRPQVDVSDGWISRTDTAKLIRHELRETFPDHKFLVRCETYSMGGCVHVFWTDGPTDKAVKAVVDKFGSSDFDGMIDLAFSWWHWLCPDGRVEIGGTAGTAESGGVRNRVENPPPCEGAVKVRLGGGYVSLHREISDAHRAAVRQAWAALSERERADLFRKLDLDRGLVPCQRPDSWRFDAELSDFNQYGARDQIFATLAHSL